MTISVNPKGLFLKLLNATIVLLVANIISILFNLYYLLPHIESNQKVNAISLKKYLVALFDFNIEMNIPTFFSSLLLMLCASLLFLIGRRGKFELKRYLGWYGLSFIFIFLSIDEMTSIHEQLITPFRTALNLSGLLFYSWVIPYGFLLLVLLSFYFKFLMRLPRKTLRLFVLSGIIYLTGAILLDMAEGALVEEYGWYDPLYCFLYTCEEFLEMLGLIIFIYALSSYKSISIAVN